MEPRGGEEMPDRGAGGSIPHWESNLVPEPRVENGERSEAMLVRKDLHKAGGRIQTKEHDKCIKEV
jgi:hypothetical protein